MYSNIHYYDPEITKRNKKHKKINKNEHLVLIKVQKFIQIK